MFRYSGFALTIDSQLELPELPPGQGDPDVVIRCGPVARDGGKATLDEEFAYNTLAGAFNIRHGDEIVVEPLESGDPAILRVVLLGRIMAFLLRQRGWLPLHASGVLVEGMGVLFLGPSGAGKSTTAAAFHARGYRVITDDVGAVRVVDERCVVVPAWPRLRLMEDSRAVLEGLGRRTEFQVDKHTVDLDHPELRNSIPVIRIYLLEYGPEFTAKLIPALPVVPLLGAHSFAKRRRMTAEALDAHLRQCALVAAATPVYRLARPQSLGSLPELVRFVEEDLVKAHVGVAG